MAAGHYSRCLLITIAFGEGGTGFLLLTSPAIPLALLLGIGEASLETLFVARVAGAALLGIGFTCWLGRSDRHGPAQRGSIAGFLFYSAAVVVLLAYAGLFLERAGIALWPAVVVHGALAVWCVVCLRASPLQ